VVNFFTINVHFQSQCTYAKCLIPTPRSCQHCDIMTAVKYNSLSPAGSYWSLSAILNRLGSIPVVWCGLLGQLVLLIMAYMSVMTRSRFWTCFSGWWRFDWHHFLSDLTIEVPVKPVRNLTNYRGLQTVEGHNLLAIGSKCSVSAVDCMLHSGAINKPS
jgi:hypothetical protein